MLPAAPFPRALVWLGLALVMIGLCWPWLSRLPLGRLPGDILIRRENYTFAFPIVTCLVISVVATIVMGALRR